VQPFDVKPIVGDPIVWRRSVPHDSTWLDFRTMRTRLPDYDIQVVVVTRDFFALAQSQLNNHHAANMNGAIQDIQKAYRSIFRELTWTGLPFVTVSYESLIMDSEQTQERLCFHLGLTFFGPVPIANQNERRWLEYGQEEVTLVG
jgi:hypothetical protein